MHDSSLRLRLATDEYRKYFERDAALARRFQPVVVEAPSPALARQMLEVLTSLGTANLLLSVSERSHSPLCSCSSRDSGKPCSGCMKTAWQQHQG